MKQERLASQAASSRAANPCLRPLVRAITSALPPPRECSVAPTPGSVQTAPPGGPPTLPPLRSQRHLVCPAAPASAVLPGLVVLLMFF